MIYKASKLIAETFDEKGIKYGGQIEEHGDASAVEAGFRIDNGPTVLARFFSSDDHNDVEARVFGIINVKEEKRQQMLQQINAANRRIRHIKFSLYENGDVNAEYDFPAELADEQVGEVAVEIFIRLMKILDDVYPDFMRAMWQ
mgnify:CR=1 FL=1